MKNKLLLLIAMVIISIGNTYADGIQWHPYSNAIYQNAKIANRDIMIFAMSDTCHWCQKMSATTMNDKKVVNYISEHFYAVKLHANQDIATARKFGLQGVPTILILDSSGKVIKMFAGYNDADQLLAQLMDITGAK